MAPQSPWKSPRTASVHLSPLALFGLAVTLLVLAVVTVTVGRPGLGTLEPLAAVHVPVDVMAAQKQAAEMDSQVDYSFATDESLRVPQATPAPSESSAPVAAESAEPTEPAAAAPPAPRPAKIEFATPERPMFNGRPIRKVRTLRMLVTAYSPDARSCGKWADGITASGYSVWTNGMKLVAADTRLLPFGSIISVPGYNGGDPVPVLDRGGAIKGRRLDVLYPTHEIARQWGAQRLNVTVWEYAD